MTTDHAIEATFAPAAPAVNARYLAEGSMDGDMETWVLAQNPTPAR
ncbi:MAG: hypothetical protein H5T74_10185 [Actinobacteria bacterium]|nr:hypothetical protein [Actinomycetota bacterium]MDI6830464.1 hypothetical protein [Actinomycetota bacterium]